MAGNAPALSKSIGLAQTAALGRNVKGVHGVITFFIKSFFFVFIGAMLGPPWSLLFFGIGLGIVLFLARVPNVIVSTARSSLSKPARALIAILMPRGMAAGVLAMMPYQEGIEGTENLPVVVFAAVLTTILLFAGGFPVFKKRLPPSDLAEGAATPSGTLAASFTPTPAQSASSTPQSTQAAAAPALARALGVTVPDGASEGEANGEGSLGEADTVAAAHTVQAGQPRIPLAAPSGNAESTTVDPGGPSGKAALPLETTGTESNDEGGNP